VIYTNDIDFNVQTVMGALLGLAVAFSLAINFIVVRQDRTVEFELALGIGALIAGLTAFCTFFNRNKCHVKQYINYITNWTDCIASFLCNAVPCITLHNRVKRQYVDVIGNCLGTIVGMDDY
jgi:hypothetical protein